MVGAVTMGLLVQHRDQVLDLVMTEGPSYNNVSETVEVIKEPEWAVDPDAVEAAKRVLRQKEITAEIAAIDGEVKTLQERKKALVSELDGL